MLQNNHEIAQTLQEHTVELVGQVIQIAHHANKPQEKLMQDMIEDTREAMIEWETKMDIMGAFAELDALSDLLNECPDKNSNEYHYYSGVLEVRQAM